MIDVEEEDELVAYDKERGVKVFRTKRGLEMVKVPVITPKAAPRQLRLVPIPSREKTGITLISKQELELREKLLKSDLASAKKSSSATATATAVPYKAAPTSNRPKKRKSKRRK